VNAYEVEAGIGVIAGNTVSSMLERLECEVLQKVRYINALTFTFTFYKAPQYLSNYCVPVPEVASRQHLRSATRHTASTDPTISSQHIRPSGFCCGWSDVLELTDR